MTTYGFIILRHVNNELTNKYWITCVNSVRQYYPENIILIIDDNSDYNYITNEPLYNTIVINSEYPKRGELLPYYYYVHNKLFDVAIIIHDSIVINKHLDMGVDLDMSVENSSLNGFKYKFLWEFEHHWDQIEDETRMIEVFNDSELKEFYNNKQLWKGCFGGMAIITHEFLSQVNNKYNFGKLIPLVLNRHNRCSFERVIACLLQKEGTQQTMLGNIHKYCKWEIKFNEIDNYTHLPLIKYWTGR